MLLTVENTGQGALYGRFSSGSFLRNCQKEMKRAVECGYWNMFRFNPMLKAEGKNPFTIDSKQPVTEEYRNFLLNEARYSSLTRSFPERAEKLFSEAEVKSVERYEHLLRLKDLYAPKAD